MWFPVMQFDSLAFIVFFTLVSAGYFLLKHWGARKNLLLVASYIFYAAWNPLLLPLLVVVSVVDWFLVNLMSVAKTARRRKVWLISIISLNISVLAFFKYAYFLADSLMAAGQWIGFEYTSPAFSIILPIGISFYIFHSLSYVVDVYKNKFPPVASLRDYMLYVGFFPQLVAGPIVRWSEMKVQIEQPRTFSANQLGFGLALMIVGLFQKVVMADAIFAPVANQYFSDVISADILASWVGILSFSGQIFCDFAGYTTCALGAALVLGFRLPLNFLNPYAARGFSDFWRRWHISLSSWLRDYLYIPLGGSEGGRYKTARNLMVTMLLGGLWHGAAWTFIVWGGIHGALLVLERILKYFFIVNSPFFKKMLQPLLQLFTFFSVALVWVWFRADNVESAWHSMVTALSLPQIFSATLNLSGMQYLALLTIFFMLITQWVFRDKVLIDILARLPSLVVGTLLAFFLTATILSPGESNAFIYFQF